MFVQSKSLLVSLLICGASIAFTPDASVSQNLQNLQSPDRSKRRAAVRALEKLKPDQAKLIAPKVIELATDQKVDRKIRLDAIYLLESLHRVSEAVIPTLIQLLNDKDFAIAEESSYTLMEIGAPAIPALEKVARSKMLAQSRLAIQTLRSIGPDSIPALIRLHDLKDARLSRYARVYLRSVLRRARRVKDKKALSLVVLSLFKKSDNQAVRAASALSLGHLGSDAPQAIPMLIQALEAEHPDLRVSSATALANLAPSDQALPVLLKAQKSETMPTVKVAIMTAMFNNSPKERRVVTALLDDAKSRHSSVRKSSLRLLGQMPWARERSIPVLIESLKNDRAADVRLAAADSLGALKASDKTAIATLISATGSEDNSVRARAVMALGSIGPKAKSSVPDLLKLIEGKNKWLASTACAAVGQIDPKNEKVIETLIGVLQEKDWRLHLEATRSLSHAGPLAKRAVPGLIRILQQPAPRRRDRGPDPLQLQTVLTLGEIGPDAKAAIPQIKALGMKYGSPYFQKIGYPFRVLEALKKIDAKTAREFESELKKTTESRPRRSRK